MSLLKIKCPECRAGLKSAAGFTAGQTVCCPKCETYFAVEEPDEDEDVAKPGKKVVKAAVDDEDDERPRKKKRKRDDDEDAEERSYKNSPVRFAVLGVLVLVMLVLGYFLYEKKKREREAAAGDPPDTVPVPPVLPPIPANAPRPQIASDTLPKNPNPKQPGPKAGGPKAGGPPLGALAGDALLGGGILSPAKVRELTTKYTAALLGSWTADLGGGATEELTYAADGTYTATRTGPGAATASGKYAVKSLVGTKGLKLELDTATGPRTIAVTFEDDELQHPSLQPGVTGSFRKK